MSKDLRGPVRTALTGVGMGLADLVPGVSGGTVAYLSGIHPRLVSVLTQAPAQLLRGKIREIDWIFALPLLGGIATAILLGAGFLEGLLHAFPQALMAIFAGLLLAAAATSLPAQSLRQWFGPFLVSSLTLGTYLLLGLPGLPSTSMGLLFGGVIALSAMLLPGISGSGILLTVGLYPTVLAAVADRDIVTLLPFALGGIVGLLGCARLLRQAFDRAPVATQGFLSGLVLAAVLAVWPWRSGADFGEGLPLGPMLDTRWAWLALGLLVVLVPTFVQRGRLESPPA